MNAVQLTKERLAEVPGVLKQLENGILHGEINPLEWQLVISSLEKWIKYAKDNKAISEVMQNEFLKYGQKTINYNGAEICFSEGKLIGYDFSTCQDHRLESIEKELAYYTEGKKAVEAELIARINQPDYCNPETGEVIEVSRPMPKYSKPFFTVKFKGK